MKRFKIKMNEIPKLKPREFKYIRKYAGVSQQKFAYFMGKRSKGTVANWENGSYMKPYHVKGLIDMVGRGLFDACRKQYEEWQEEIRKNNEAYIIMMQEEKEKEK